MGALGSVGFLYDVCRFSKVSDGIIEYVFLFPATRVLSSSSSV